VRFSILIPARDEQAFIGACLDSILEAARPYRGQVEIIVALNRCTDRTEEIAMSYNAVVVKEDARNLAKIRNVAAGIARGEILVTIDADTTMSPNMLTEIDRHLLSGKYIGGGVLILPERVSLGIVLTALVIAPVVLWQGLSAGLFWCYRKDFEAVGGFDESFTSAEDLKFAKDLKAYGKKHGKRLKTIRRASITTSCRKFDTFGDWYLLRNLGFAWKLFKGKDPKAADTYWYDVER
jgi:glycosyltransferase involved in cell wall biosynthesis